MTERAQRILVTGAAGFVGSHLVEALLARGDHVVGLDNLSTGHQANLEQALASEAFTFVQGDIRDQAVVTQACQGVDLVYHLAAVISPSASLQDPETYHAVNVTGTLNVILAALHAEVRRLVFASSAAVYGTAPGLPVKETMPLSPLSPYGATKIAGEYYCQTLTAAQPMEVSILRFFNLYGPRQPVKGEAGVISLFLHRLQQGQPLILFGDGQQTRDFLFIHDAVNVLLRCAEVAELPPLPINVGTGQAVSIRALIDLLENLWPEGSIQIREEPARAGDIYHSVADVTRLQELLQYQAQYPLRHGLKATIQQLTESSD